ncbi:MAG: glycosyltransferase involved in cell wall biosynthesis [Candidatus Pseudothioglobus sp.]|jgi:glycosyltransferase involved in cell wall biosynthesis
MTQKIIWLINQYASTPQTGMGGRHYYLARELAKQGHKVYLIAASYTHLLRHPPSVEQPYENHSVEGFNLIWIKMPDYAEAHSKKRIFNWFSFAWKLRGLKGFVPDSPDTILYSSPSLVGFLGAKYLARHYSARLAFEVRDIWPLTLVELGGYSSRHLFVRFLQWIEDKAYRDADVVISNLKKSVDHMVVRGMPLHKFFWIPNGVSVDEVAYARPLSSVVQEQIPQNKFIVGYAGTLGLANAMNVFVEAAEILKAVEEIAFVIVGDGKERQSLQALMHKKNIGNLHFIDPVSKPEVQSMLALFDVCYLGWNNDALYRFGIAPNKIPEYLYSGRPILHSFSGECDSVVEAKAGLTVQAENSQAVAEAVMKLYRMSASERETLGSNGRRYVLEHHEYGNLAKKLTQALLGDK